MTYTIRLNTSETQFTCDSDATLLNAALAAGIVLPYGCKNGACGSCKATLTSGTVVHGAHNPNTLTEGEIAAGLCLPCVAKPTSDIDLQARVVQGAGDIPIKKLPTRVITIDPLASDVMQVTLQLPATERMLFKAGQYMEFMLRDGSRRAYSMANAPHEDGPVTLHIRHMAGGKFTDALFGKTEPAVKVRDIMRIEAPLGTFFLREKDAMNEKEQNLKPIILLASGTGFAPIQSIAKHIAHHNINATRPVVLYWGGRSKQDLYLHDWATQWATDNINCSYVPVLSDAKADDAWTGRTGFVHQAVMADIADMAAYEVYVCGAPIVVSSAQRDFVAKCHLPEPAFFADSFTSAADA